MLFLRIYMANFFRLYSLGSIIFCGAGLDPLGRKNILQNPYEFDLLGRLAGKEFKVKQI